MTFKDSLHVMSTDFLLKLIFPDKAMGLTARTQRTRKAFKELQVSLNSCLLILKVFPFKALHGRDDP